MHHFGLIVGLGVLAVGLLLGAGALVAFVASLTVAAIAAILGLWAVDYLSAGARAERAARAGRIGQALALYSRKGTDYQSVQLLSIVLPSWPDARKVLCDAFRELAAVEKLVDGARAVGVSRGLLDPLDREVAVTAEVLDDLANRLGVAGAASGRESEAPAGLDRTVARIDQIAEALRAAHLGVVELTLLGDTGANSARDLTTACVRLQALGEAARELVLLEHGPS